MTVQSIPLVPPHQFSVEGCKQLLTLQLPTLESLKGVDLDIGATEVRLLLPGSCDHLLIPLPKELHANPSPPTAKFSRKRGELTISWEVAGSPTDGLPVVENSSTHREAACAPEAETLPAADIEVDPEHECLELVQEEVEYVLKQFTVQKLKSIAAIGGASVLLSDFAVEGQANIKGDCCRFQASISFSWEVMDAFGGFLGSTGTGEVPDFTQNEVSPKVTIKASKNGSRLAQAAGDWMKSKGACLISECLNGKDIAATILSEWEPPEIEAPRVPLTQWSKTYLEEKIASLNVKLFGGSACATFSSPKVSGEVSTSTKGGKPDAAFQLRLECVWSITTVTCRGKSEGTLVVPQFTSEHGSESAEVQVEAGPGKKVSGQLLTGLRQMGVSAVRTALARYVQELQLQIKS